MSEKRLILELGSGTDLYGGDYTKAACRAVEDAMHHSAITLFDPLGVDHREMQVRITVGVQQPDAVDLDAVRAVAPRGQVSVRAVLGGLDIKGPDGQDLHIVASASVEAFLDVDPAAWRLSTPT